MHDPLGRYRLHDVSPVPKKGPKQDRAVTQP